MVPTKYVLRYIGDFRKRYFKLTSYDSILKMAEYFLMFPLKTANFSGALQITFWQYIKFDSRSNFRTMNARKRGMSAVNFLLIVFIKVYNEKSQLPDLINKILLPRKANILQTEF